jgi:hypothetical protein
VGGQPVEAVRGFTVDQTLDDLRVPLGQRLGATSALVV